jgi:thiol-disulfide isomerase/thioredoxin
LPPLPATSQKPTPRVVLYHAPGCHLCDSARETLLALRKELGFDLVEIDVGGDPVLEDTYREWLPVVEIDGERAFVYFVDPDGFRRRLGRTMSGTNARR